MSTKITRLPENSDEARDFRSFGGSPLHGVHSALRIWAETHSFPDGSQAKVMAVMANVVAEAIQELETLRGLHEPVRLTDLDLVNAACNADNSFRAIEKASLRANGFNVDGEQQALKGD